MTWQSYETLFKGVGDRRLRHVLVIAAHLEDLLRYCAGTVLVLTRRNVRVDLLVVAGDEPGAHELGVSDARGLAHRALALPDEDTLRGELVRHIRLVQPEVVVTVDPTPVLRQHPDHRRVARAALDAAWPYAGAAQAHPDAGPAHQPKEAWLYSGPEPDLFVPLDDELRETLAGLGRPDWQDTPEERFVQVDFRPRPGAEVGEP